MGLPLHSRVLIIFAQIERTTALPQASRRPRTCERILGVACHRILTGGEWGASDPVGGATGLPNAQIPRKWAMVHVITPPPACSPHSCHRVNLQNVYPLETGATDVSPSRHNLPRHHDRRRGQGSGTVGSRARGGRGVRREGAQVAAPRCGCIALDPINCVRREQAVVLGVRLVGACRW